MPVITWDAAAVALVEREWQRVASPGAWFDGSQRVELAAIARAARGEVAVDADTLSPPSIEAARLVATDPGAITEEWIAGLETNGLTRMAYAELLGVVARMQAIDTLCFATGAELRPMPAPVGGEATGEIPDGLRAGRAWVPMTGPAPAVDALSAVPDEQQAQLDVAATLYISGADIGDRTYRRELERVQMELVVCRTSLLNRCFY